MSYEEFNEDIVRLIRTFGDTRHVYAKMVFIDNVERWVIREPSIGEFMIPEGVAVGDALRMFPEFKDVL